MNTSEQIARAIGAHRFQWRDEYDVQASIAVILDQAGIGFEREVRLNPRDRLDFLAGNVAVEVKVSGSTAATQRQVVRYLKSDRIASLVLVTAKAAHLKIVVPNVRVVWIGGSL